MTVPLVYLKKRCTGLYCTRRVFANASHEIEIDDTFGLRVVDGDMGRRS
jgi:hypothetical protein